MKKLFKGVIAILLLLVITLPLTFISAAATSLAQITFSDVSARKGETLEIVVTLSDCKKVKAVAIEPIYSTEKLEYLSGEWLIGGGLLQDWSHEEQNGVILYSAEEDINGDIAKFSFRIRENVTWDDIAFSANVVVKDAQGDVEIAVTPINIYVFCDHVFEETIYTQDPTCTEEGYTYKMCTICERRHNLDAIEKVPHTPSEWIVDKESTLFQEGEHHKECTVCGTVLEREAMPLLGQCAHRLGDEIFTEEPTSTNNGMLYRVCDICGEKVKIFDIPKTGVPMLFTILISAGCAIVSGGLGVLITWVVSKKRR